MSAINLTEATFEETINSEGILLIDWWAEWCGPCKQFAPIFESAAEKHQDITFAKIDTDKVRAEVAAEETQAEG